MQSKIILHQFEGSMQVIHRYNGFYPFQLEEQSQQTYLQVLKEDLTDEQINIYRKRYKIIKGIDHTNLIKLVRIYKEQSKLHLLYEYYPLSLQKYVQSRSQSADKNQYKPIYDHFVEVMANIIDIFIKFQIKTEIIIQNFAVADIQNGHLKLFVDPQAEFIGISSQNQISEKQAKLNKEYLQQFYLAEKKRVAMQFQELLEKYFGKMNGVTQNNRPNFIINGSKLVFINNHDHKNMEKQRKNDNTEQIHDRFGAKTDIKRPLQSHSPVKTQKSQLKRDLKEKTLKKLTQIKSVLNRFEAKAPPQQEDYCNYPQNDQIVFRAQEITNDKTALLQENQYLQSLENEIEKINEAKRLKQQQQGEEKRALIIKQISQLQEKNKKYSQLLPKGHNQSERYQQHRMAQRFKDNKSIPNLQKNSKNDSNLSKNDSKNNDRSANSFNSEEMLAKPQQKKEDKSNRYKMTIVTSHQIQIEGSQQQQAKESQRDTTDGNKSTKNNLTQASQKLQRPKTVKPQTQQSNHLYEKKNKIPIDDNANRLNSRNSDIASKSKKINEIIQKINSKSNINNQLSNSSHHPQQKIENGETLSSYKSNMETTDHPQDNYYDKIREAKTKAEQVLKEYAKKKQ